MNDEAKIKPEDALPERTAGSQQRVVGGLAEIFERAKGAVADHCRTGMKPAGRSEMYRDMMHGVLDQLRAHCEKPSNDELTHREQ